MGTLPHVPQWVLVGPTSTISTAFSKSHSYYLHSVQDLLKLQEPTSWLGGRRRFSNGWCRFYPLDVGYHITPCPQQPLQLLAHAGPLSCGRLSVGVETAANCRRQILLSGWPVDRFFPPVLHRGEKEQG